MIEYLEIGPVPSQEPCAQVGTDNYPQHASRECRAYIGQIRRAYGVEPLGAVLRIKRNPHDYGTYLEVACYYDPSSETAINYAFRIEEDPDNKLREWDAEARQELGI